MAFDRTFERAKIGVKFNPLEKHLFLLLQACGAETNSQGRKERIPEILHQTKGNTVCREKDELLQPLTSRISSPVRKRLENLMCSCIIL